jgi:hypothetical protein
MKALASLQRDHDINEDEAMRAEELAQEQEKEARTEQLKKTIKDATWEFADEQGMIEYEFPLSSLRAFAAPDRALDWSQYEQS